MIENYISSEQESTHVGFAKVEWLNVVKIYIDPGYFIKKYNISTGSFDLYVRDLISIFYNAKINTKIFDNQFKILELKYIQPNMIYVEYKCEDSDLISAFSEYLIDLLEKLIAGSNYEYAKHSFIKDIEIIINKIKLNKILVNKNDSENIKTKI